MKTEDMIIVSVDDHVVEPPDLFERHLPAKYRDVAPRIIHKDDGTDVWFHMYGANLNLDADGNVESVTDGASALAGYYALCEAAGIPRPNVLVD